MAIAIEALFNQNITVVFDSLDLASVDSGKLKTLRGPGTQAAVMDVPEMIVAVFPPEPLLVQIGERRIRVTVQGASEIGSVPLWDYVTKCVKLVSAAKQKVIAYGFNYDAVVSLAGSSADDIIRGRFMGQARDIEEKLEGQIETIAPRLKFRRDDVSYDLIIEPGSEGKVKVHLNAHFEVASHRLPPAEKLKLSFMEQYSYFVGSVCQLLD